MRELSRAARATRFCRAQGRSLAILGVAALAVSACGSDTAEDDPTQPVDSGTVVPPDDSGVGGGVPIDNLNDNVADTSFQNTDDVNGDGDPES